MGPAAHLLRPFIDELVAAPPPVRFEFWDGSTLGPDDAERTVLVRSPDAVRRILRSPGELGVARAYVAGDLDADGDLVTLLRVLQDAVPERPSFSPRLALSALPAAGRLGLLRGAPPPPPEEAARTRGVRHSKARDRRMVSHHYDIGNDFYRLLLGPSLTYSCARFVDADATLEDAQASKHELVCRKLGLHRRPGARLLDVGCGWGSLAIHAATCHGTEVVGVTASEEQRELAARRVGEAGVDDLVEIRLQDYRDVDDGPFDAVSSIGMFEHVGVARMGLYFSRLRELLAPTGRLLNHAISSAGGSKLSARSFMGRYVFPDAELIDVGQVLLAMESAGFEVRDVEALREHYARTVRAWSQNLDTHWSRAVDLVGERRARIWKLYLAGSAVAFDDGGLSVHQVLGVVPDETGGSAMPPTRADWG